MKKINLILVLAISLFLFGCTTASVLPSATITRTITPSSSQANGVFTISYTVSGATDKYGGIIKETIPAGFSLPTLVSGLDIKITGSLVEIPFTSTSIPTWTLKAASSSGNLVGTFDFSAGVSGAIGGTSALTICSPSCTGKCGGSNGCGGTCPNTCTSPQVCYSNVCCSPTCTRPTNQCTLASSVSNGCGAYCTGSWTITQKSSADSDCNNNVENQELLSYIDLWVANSATNEQLLSAIDAWATST